MSRFTLGTDSNISKTVERKFDVIITDSSDPKGPAETLYQEKFFEPLHAALKEGGVVTKQGTYTAFFSINLSVARAFRL